MKKHSSHHRPKRPRHNIIQGCVTVTAAECGDNPEKMVRRFIKKVKNEKIIEEYRDRSVYKKPSEIKSQEKRNRRRLIEKVNKQNQLLAEVPVFLT